MKKLSKTIKIIGNILFGLLVGVMILLVIALGRAKATGQAPSVLGHHMYIVVSGSMNPTFDTGSLVVVKQTDPRLIKERDIITFKGAGSSQGLTSHRVTKVNNTPDGLSFTTKGDANQVEDGSPIQADKLVGKIVLAIPYLGYLMNFIRTKQGMLIFVLIPASILMIFEVIKVVKAMKKESLELEKEMDES